MIPQIIVPYSRVGARDTVDSFNVYTDDNGDLFALHCANVLNQSSQKTGLIFTNKNGTLAVDSKEVMLSGQLYKNFDVVVPGPFMGRVAVREQQQAQVKSNEAIEEFNDRRRRIEDVVGTNAMKKAEDLRVMVWGCGRAGSLLALRLVQDGIGAKGGIVLVDPDTVENVNLDGTMVFEMALNKPKAAAVATMCKAFDGNANVFPLIDAFSNKTFDALVSSDVIFTPIDSDSARGNIMLVAARYHKVVIDLNSGVLKRNETLESAGHNASIFIPGTQGCPICLQDKRITNADMKPKVEMSAQEYIENNKRPDSRLTHSDEICASVSDALHLFWGTILGRVAQGMTLGSTYNYITCRRESTGRMLNQNDTQRCIFCNDRNIIGIPV